MSFDPFQALYSGTGGVLLLLLTTIESTYPTVCFGYFTSLGSTVCPFRRIWKLWPGIFPAAEWDVANILKFPLHITCKRSRQCQGGHWSSFNTYWQPEGEVLPNWRSTHKGEAVVWRSTLNAHFFQYMWSYPQFCVLLWYDLILHLTLEP